LVKIVPYWGLTVIGTTLAFFVPLVYTSNQELIDHHLKQATDVINAQTHQLRDVASKHTAQAADITKQYMGDYTAKAQQMLRGRSTSPAAVTKKPKVQETDFPAAPTSDLKAAEPAVPAEEPVVA
jgi:endo-beta-N-acetylglucosaminidase D